MDAKIGEVYKLTPTNIIEEGALCVPDYTSSDESIVTVVDSANGEATVEVLAEGLVTITAKANNVISTLDIYSTAPFLTFDGTQMIKGDPLSFGQITTGSYGGQTTSLAIETRNVFKPGLEGRQYLINAGNSDGQELSLYIEDDQIKMNAWGKLTPFVFDKATFDIDGEWIKREIWPHPLGFIGYRENGSELQYFNDAKIRFDADWIEFCGKSNGSDIVTDGVVGDVRNITAVQNISGYDGIYHMDNYSTDVCSNTGTNGVDWTYVNVTEDNWT